MRSSPKAVSLVRRNVGKEQTGRLLKLDDLGWPRSASSSTFIACDIPGSYDDMATVQATERKAGVRSDAAKTSASSTAHMMRAPAL